MTTHRPFLVLLLAIPLAAQSHPAPIPSDAALTTPSERLALLRPVCGAHANENGCDACPPGTDFPNEQLLTRGVVYGHLLGAHSEDAAVGFFGCESHVTGLGGTFLLSKSDSAWKRVSLRPTAIVDDCKKLPAPDGHDVLICYGADGHQGVTNAFLYLVDFASGPNPDQGFDIFFGVTDSAEGCMLIPGVGLVSATIERVSFGPQGRIAVQARLGRITPAQFQPIAAQCPTGGVTPHPLGLRLATVLKTYTFSFDGAHVTPIPGNPPTLAHDAVAPVTRALLPARYTAPDRGFTIPVPYTYRTIRNPASSPLPVCEASALVCLLYPGSSTMQAAIEISKIDATTQQSCLNPEHLPGRSTHFVPGTYGYSVQLPGSPGKYEFWTGSSGPYQLDQSVNRVWHKESCYQVSANIAHPPNQDVDKNRIAQDLVWVVSEFRFLTPR